MSEASSPVGAVVAVSPEGVIGRDNRIPWHRPADLARFKRLTTGGAIIMGRRTFESIGRPLPHRKNIVVSTTLEPTPEIQVARSLEDALTLSDEGLSRFIIGGARLFDEAFRWAAEWVDLTLVPDRVAREGDTVLLPALDPEVWVKTSLVRNEQDPMLWHQRLERWPKRST